MYDGPVNSDCELTQLHAVRFMPNNTHKGEKLMPLDTIPWQIAVPLSAVLWAALLIVIFRHFIADLFSAYFADRRHKLRMRNLKKNMRYDADLTTYIYAPAKHHTATHR